MQGFCVKNLSFGFGGLFPLFFAQCLVETGKGRERCELLCSVGHRHFWMGGRCELVVNGGHFWPDGRARTSQTFIFHFYVLQLVRYASGRCCPLPNLRRAKLQSCHSVSESLKLHLEFFRPFFPVLATALVTNQKAKPGQVC